MEHPHVHTWEPIQGWHGRYRCGCGVAGYRKLVTQVGCPWVIEPYKCPKCSQPTTGRKQSCPACRKTK